MIDLIYSPKWFYGRDIIIDVISIIVLFLLSFFSTKSYKISGNKNYKTLGMSFLLIGLSFAFKILMNFTIYFESVVTRKIGYATFTYEKIISSDNLFFVGFLAYRILTLLGLYMLFSIYNKQSKATSALVVFLLASLMYFSNSSYYVFHIASLAILMLITLHYFNNYSKTRYVNTKLLVFSFLMISISQALCIFINMNKFFYVEGEVLQLGGYLLLLATFIKVLRDGKKKIET